MTNNILTRHASCAQGYAMTDNLFGEKATHFGHQELVFEWRPLNEQQQKTTPHPAKKWLMYGLMLALAGSAVGLITLFYAIDPYFATKLKALSWHDLGNFLLSFASAGVVQIKLLVYGLVVAAVFWGRRMQRGSRLYLSRATLSQRSGLPLWLGNLLRQNWTLSLDELHSGRFVFTLIHLVQARAPSPLAMYGLRWKAANATLSALMPQPQLFPASWFLIGQEARKPPEMPQLGFWLRSANPWATPEGQAALQTAFDQLPLVAALRAQGLSLPVLSSVRLLGLGDGSFDLMADPRMKAVVLGFFGLIASAALAFHFTRHQHYFEPPPLFVWLAVGACCALGAWLWQMAQDMPEGPSLRPIQGLLAVMLGLASALFSPFALLGVNQVVTSTQQISVSVSQAPLRLQPEDSRIPAFAPQAALEFWASLPANSRRQMTVHQGLFGTWQYDSAPLQDEVEAFYRQHGRR